MKAPKTKRAAKPEVAPGEAIEQAQSTDDLPAAIDRLGETALRIKRERDALLAALKTILAHPRTDDRCIVFMPDEVAAACAAIALAEAET